MQAFLLAYIQETEERLSKKAALRTQNLAVAKDRPELNTAMLDSSLKKNTAFIKKLVSNKVMPSCLESQNVQGTNMIGMFYDKVITNLFFHRKT